MQEEKNKRKRVEQQIIELVRYGIDTGLVEEEDFTYTVNRLLDVMKLDGFWDGALPARCANLANSGETEQKEEEGERLEKILAVLLMDARDRGLISDSITEQDLFDTRLMGCLLERPSHIIEKFKQAYENSPRQATDFFYRLCQNCDYIRRYRIKKDKKWDVASEYGQLDITINLSKPEKDPRAIAAAAAESKKRKGEQEGMQGAVYPHCQLCVENEGYAGRMNHPARQNLRVIPLSLSEESWYMQYSPYVYYNEHCIVLCGEHRPMKISPETFVRLFDFLDLFPHYFIGSNADLPIVGGSILTHDHFQGGCYEFAMERAKIAVPVKLASFPDVEVGILKWPLSVLRLRGSSRDRITELATHVLEQWRSYTDEKAFVYAYTDGQPHNTITPIARMRGSDYELDLVLRNNLTTEEYPLGIYHPHPELHHIKKENIGLIEVMGLAVLPARLQSEKKAILEILQEGGDVMSKLQKDERTCIHADWMGEVIGRYPGLIEKTEAEQEEILQQEIGKVFVKVLEDAGVYKNTPEGLAGFQRFLAVL